MHSKDRVTFWHYVIWAPHSFLALVLYFVAQVFFLALIYARGEASRAAVSDQKATILSFLASVLVVLVYWVPASAHSYALLRLHRRMGATRNPTVSPPTK